MTTNTPNSTSPKDFSSLRRHLQAMATLPVTENPVLSIYLDLRQNPARLKHDFLSWAAAARSTLDPQVRRAFDEAAADVGLAIGQTWPGEIRSVAVFARSGETPLLLVLPFAAHLESFFHLAEMPAIFPLVQMKDRFHRFVVAISTEEYARIYEITLGATSEELLTTRPEMRKRIGREWTREHYHQHKRETDRRFLKDQVMMIGDLMDRRGINHLILAGSPQAVSALRMALPKQLEKLVVEAIYHTPRMHDCSQVLEDAVTAFIDHEQDESRSTVELLHENVRRNALAVVGIHVCRRAMELGIASELVISEELPVADREELVRLATSIELPIEVCENDELLDSHGGVGCLLRYRPHGFPGNA